MSKRKYQSVAYQDRLGRVGARLLLSLGFAVAAVLLKSTLVQAEPAAPVTSTHQVEMSNPNTDLTGQLGLDGARSGVITH